MLIAKMSISLQERVFFIFAKVIKKKFPNSKIIGEVHTPLPLIDPTVDFAPEAIDTYRVGLQSAHKYLCEKYTNNNIVHFPVSIRHLRCREISNVRQVKENVSFMFIHVSMNRKKTLPIQSN